MDELDEQTLRGYRSSWRDFKRWCQREEKSALSAETDTVLHFVKDRAEDLSDSALRNRLAAIRHFHKKAGLDSPTDDEYFRKQWRTYMKIKGVESDDAIDLRDRLREDQKALIYEPSDSLRVVRGRAIILLGIAGDMRRTELTRLDRSGIKEGFQSMRVRVRRAVKGTPTEILRIKPLAEKRFCPVQATRNWISRAQIEDGPLFRGINRHGRVTKNRLSGKGVTRAVKRAAREAGLDPDRYSAENLRKRPAK